MSPFPLPIPPLPSSTLRFSGRHASGLRTKLPVSRLIQPHEKCYTTAQSRRIKSGRRRGTQAIAARLNQTPARFVTRVQVTQREAARGGARRGAADSGEPQLADTEPKNVSPDLGRSRQSIKHVGLIVAGLCDRRRPLSVSDRAGAGSPRAPPRHSVSLCRFVMG